MARLLTRKEGLFSGISTGAIVHAALKVAVELGKGKTVVAVLCDTGERYLSHPLYAEIDGSGAVTVLAMPSPGAAGTASGGGQMA